MDFIGTIAIATKAIEGLKLLRGLEKTFGEASFKMQIADITSNFSDLKTALVDAKSEAAEKDAEISRLKSEFAFRAEKTIRKRGFAYEQDSKGGPQGMPFCPRCETVDGRLIRIVEAPSKHKGGGRTVLCPQCKADYETDITYTYESDRPV